MSEFSWINKLSKPSLSARLTSQTTPPSHGQLVLLLADLKLHPQERHEREQPSYAFPSQRMKARGGSGLSSTERKEPEITGWMIDREAVIHPQVNGSSHLQLALLTQLPLGEARGSPVEKRNVWPLSFLFIHELFSVSPALSVKTT